MENQLKKTDIFKLCSTFDKKEALKCSIFLSEFTNASKKCILLYDEIFEYYKKAKFCWEDVNISIAAINKKLFGKTEDTNNTRVLRSKLYKNVKQYCEFLDTQKLKKEKPSNVEILKYLVKRKNNELFKKEYQKMEKSLELAVNVDSLEDKYHSYYSYLEFNSINLEKNSTSNYNELFQHFSFFSMITKMQQYCAILNQKLIENIDVIPEIEEEMRYVFAKAKQNDKIGFIAEMYETASLMLQNNITQHNRLAQYHRLKKLTEVNLVKMNDDDKKIFYALMDNFCNSSNNVKLINEFRLNYLKQFEEKLLHEGEYIILMRAKSLCTTILNLTRIEDKTNRLSKSKAEQKIKEVVKEMSPEHRESTQYFHLAILDYYFGDYEKTIEKLKDSPKYANAFFDFDARVTLQRCYYFTENVETFDKSIRNFQLALKNDKDLSEKHKTEYFNFTKAIQILQNAKFSFGKKEKQEKLDQLNIFLEKNPTKVLKWFNAQIQEIVKK